MHVSILELEPPLHVGLASTYGWDEIVWFQFSDINGNTGVVYLDRQPNSATFNRLIQGKRHPSKPGGQLVELGSVEEGLILSTVSRWMDSDQGHRHFTEHGWEAVRNALDHYGEPVIE